VQEPVRKRLVVVVGALGLAACDPVSAPEDGVSRSVAVPRLIEPPEAQVPPPTDPAVIAAAEAIAEAVRDGDPYARARRLAVLLPSLGSEGVPGVKEVLRDPRLLLYRGGAEIELLARFWATHEPEEATRWAVEDAPRGYRLSAVFSTLSRWAALDPHSALVAVQEWEGEQSDVRDLVQIALVHGWFEKDPVELARHIQQHEMGIARQRRLSNYVRLLIHHQGVEAAMRWAESVPEDDTVYKRNVYRQMGSALVAFDVEVALRWCEAHCDGPYGAGIRSAIATRWAKLEGGGAAVSWLLSQPQGADRSVALRDAFWSWADRHPDEVAAWMRAGSRGTDGEPEPEVRLLSAPYAELLIPKSPAEAIRWAQWVEDEGMRERLLIRIARAWRFRDEAAAEAWLRESPLSEESRERAREGLPPRFDRPKS
jgi:hypothetical protein